MKIITGFIFTCFRQNVGFLFLNQGFIAVEMKKTLLVFGQLFSQRSIFCGVLLTLASMDVVDAAGSIASPVESAKGHLAEMSTQVYTLKPGENTDVIAKRHGITSSELKALNRFRFFAHGFEHLHAGDELEIPVTPFKLNDKTLLGKEAVAISEDERKWSTTASKLGAFSHSKDKEHHAVMMAKGIAENKVSQVIHEWTRKLGNVQFQLDIDDKFSLKNSQFDLLHPYYETREDLLFSQDSIHRTSERTQMNVGFGWRHFTDYSMFGSNLFLDYDLSRDHTRAGVGSEYWLNYLKLGVNAYIGLTGWKNSPDVEDYDERPANGWDLRVDGWLPEYPQLGSKFVYEQYYGREVGLFGRNQRQKNPHAFTVGMNWTPFPLLTLSAEQRQGKSGENDTRLGVNVRWQFGVPLSQQLNDDTVRHLRSVTGSRYDFIERNNDIVLEYRKQEVITLSLPEQVRGQPGQLVRIAAGIKSKYVVKDVIWDESALSARGGKLTGQGAEWLLMMPEWTEGASGIQISAVAHDVKGNESKRAVVNIVVDKPEVIVSPKLSILSTNPSTLSADGVSTSRLTLELKDMAGQPVTGKTVTTAALTGAGAPGSRVSDWVEQNNGIYTATFTAGTYSGPAGISPLVDGNPVISAPVNVMLSPSISPDKTTFRADPLALDADGVSTSRLTLELKDMAGQPVTGKTVTTAALTGAGAP
ncbi:inverse autotransporter beta domain-containing protein, partial [Salmonella bongori]